MNNSEIMKIALEQSMKDYSIEIESFSKDGYTIYPPRVLQKDARNYLKHQPFCNFVYYGKSLVVIADESLHPFLDNYLGENKNELYRVFDAPQITKLNNKLEEHGYCIAHLADFYLPDVTYQPLLNKEIKTKILLGDELLDLYDDKRFPMALGYSRTEVRRDEIAIVGYINDEIVGVAGASNDSSTMWQIGIDVLPNYRFKGIASTLTYLLSKEILKIGKVPFYCCAWSNIASRNTARKAGFRSAWVELTAKSINEDWIKKIR